MYVVGIGIGIPCDQPSMRGEALAHGAVKVA
jgi:hypothetical protein